MTQKQLPFLFTAHAIERLAGRFDIGVPQASEWLRESKTAHKSHVEAIEGLFQREHKALRKEDTRIWMTNIEHDVAFLIKDSPRHRTVITVLRVRLRPIAIKEQTEMRDGRWSRTRRKLIRQQEAHLE